MTSVSQAAVVPLAVEGVSREYLLHHRVCPDRLDGDGALIVAVGPGAFLEAIPELEAVYDRRLITRDVADDDLERMIERVTSGADDDSIRTIGDEDDAADVREIANQPPVIRYVNTLLHDAYEANASDIHIESTRVAATARVRVDGVLEPATEPPRRLHEAVVSRVKLLADLDISERRRPQDGRIRVRVQNTDLYLRVSTVPTVYGESVVLRLLDRGNRPADLSDLGMPERILKEMTAAIERPHGMMLVTGPTGSGKTTTLYSALRRRDIRSEKIVTVEDPVEYQLDGVTQVPVHRQAGVTFASALRSILRQDPDVIMIGEMRDTETAEIAIQASMTGHLVFSTLHTNDAIGALPRLIDLGIAPYLIAATITAIMAQRLVRIACPACKSPTSRPRGLPGIHDDMIAEIRADQFVSVSGCSGCRGTGFKGRIGIFEVVSVGDRLQAAIAATAPRSELLAIAHDDGYRPMIADGIAKAAAGITTMGEVLRVCNA